MKTQKKVKIILYTFLSFSILVMFAGGLYLFLVNQNNGHNGYACQRLSKKVANEENSDTSDFTTGSFFSTKLNTCVQTQILNDHVGNFSFRVRDIGGGLIRKENRAYANAKVAADDGGTISDTAYNMSSALENLFYCDVDGIDNTVTEKVLQHNGYIWDLPYKDYYDDFRGGLPRTLQTPNHRFTIDECQNEFELKIEEIK